MEGESVQCGQSVLDYLQQLNADKRRKRNTMVQIMGTDLDGQLRGKAVSMDKVCAESLASGFGFCSVLFDWDMLDRLVAINNDLRGTFSEQAVPDPSSLKKSLPWHPNYPTLLVDFKVASTEGQLEPLPYCPRGVLKKMVQGYESRGLNIMVGMEVEWYNFIETPESMKAKNYTNLQPLTTGMTGYSVQRLTVHAAYVEDLYQGYAALDIPIECFHTETGPGVYEAALSPCSALQAADRLQLFKWSTRVIGGRHGVMPTFMAKIDEALPGCGGHIHLSLWSKESQNLFSHPSDAQPNQTTLHFMGGILAALPDLMPFFAPTINSYKRLDRKYWTPVELSWGRQNRMAAIRWIPSTGASARIEVRVGGSDLHPYFAVAALMAAGLHGVENKVDPGPCCDNVRNSAAPPAKMLPRDLATATSRMKAKTSMARVLLGDVLVDKCVKAKEWECHLFDSAVTDWERRRYLELV